MEPPKGRYQPDAPPRAHCERRLRCRVRRWGKKPTRCALVCALSLCGHLSGGQRLRRCPSETGWPALLAAKRPGARGWGWGQRRSCGKGDLCFGDATAGPQAVSQFARATTVMKVSMLERAIHRFALPEEIVQDLVRRKRLIVRNKNEFKWVVGW